MPAKDGEALSEWIDKDAQGILLSKKARRREVCIVCYLLYLKKKMESRKKWVNVCLLV